MITNGAASTASRFQDPHRPRTRVGIPRLFVFEPTAVEPSSNRRRSSRSPTMLVSRHRRPWLRSIMEDSPLRMYGCRHPDAARFPHPRRRARNVNPTIVPRDFTVAAGCDHREGSRPRPGVPSANSTRDDRAANPSPQFPLRGCDPARLASCRTSTDYPGAPPACAAESITASSRPLRRRRSRAGIWVLGRSFLGRSVSVADYNTSLSSTVGALAATYPDPPVHF